MDLIGRSLKTPRRVLLSIRDVGKQVNKFRHAVALRYQNDQGDDRISFAIDGFVRPELESSFMAKDGLTKIRLESFDHIKRRDELSSEITDLKKNSVDDDQVLQLTEAEQLAYEQVSEAEVKVLSSQSIEDRINAETERDAAVVVLEDAKDRLRTAARIRNLSVYEHAAVFDDALKNSVSRLRIISPWIRRKVVNETFILDIESLLKKKVDVFIGYGIGDDKFDKGVVNKLIRLSERYSNFEFKEFGDTHAKVLLSDSRYYVVGSFNWLSFRGDSLATFRDEQSVLVSIPE